MIGTIAAGLGLLGKLPELWDGVASIFGWETPDTVKMAGKMAQDVAGAIAGKTITAQERMQLEELFLNHKERILALKIQADAEDRQKLEAVNATMRSEAVAEHWPQYSWRPFWGFVSALAFLAVCCLCCWLAFDAVHSRNMAALNVIPQMVGAFSTLFAIPGAILGVTAWHRGKEKREKNMGENVRHG